MKLALSPAALCDLQSISDYTARTWGQEQEARYLEGVWEKLEEIRSRPDIYKFRADLPGDCFSARFGKHVLFFAVVGNTVEVIRILHASMDFYTHLSPE